MRGRGRSALYYKTFAQSQSPICAEDNHAGWRRRNVDMMLRFPEWVQRAETRARMAEPDHYASGECVLLSMPAFNVVVQSAALPA